MHTGPARTSTSCRERAACRPRSVPRSVLSAFLVLPGGRPAPVRGLLHYKGATGAPGELTAILSAAATHYLGFTSLGALQTK